MELQFNCYKKDGRLHIRNKALFDAEVDNMHEGKEYTLVLKKKRKQRSIPQNSYYYGAVLPIIYHALRDLGFSEVKTKEDAHEIIKYKFLKTTINNEQGEFIERIKSTTELSTSQFMDFIAELQMWASEFLGVNIPSPNEQVEINLE